MRSHKRFLSFLIAAALLVPATVTAIGPQAQGAGMIDADEYQALLTQANWLDQLASRLERRGRAISDSEARELRLVAAEVARLEKIRRATGDAARTGILRQDAEELLDRMAQLWVNLRVAGGSDTLAAGPAPQPTAAPAPAPTMTIPQRTNAVVRLSTWLSSKNAVVGDRFSAQLVDPIMVEGKVAVPAGALFEGLVTEVDRAGRGSDAGKLNLYIDRLRGDQGQIAEVRGLVIGLASGEEIEGRGADVGKTAAIGAAGGVLGAILGGARGALIGLTVGAGGSLLAEKGKDVELPQGSTLRVEMQSPVSVTWSWRPMTQ